MLTIFSRIIHYGFANFVRNGWPSAATVAIMVLALLVSIGLIFFNVMMDHAVDLIQSKIDISVYFKPGVAEDDILNVKQTLESLSEVRQVEYISTDRALELTKERYADDASINKALNEININPFVASLNIEAHDPEQYASIAEYLSSPNLEKYFEKVSYFENQQLINRLVFVIQNVNRFGLALTVIIAIIAGLVVFNTIRLAIYSNRDEISIMRSVGASNALVRGPYMIEGIIAGVISGVVSIIVAAPIVYFASPYIEKFIPGLAISGYYYTNIISLLGYQLLFGVVIGIFSSFVAVRRYLRN